MHQAHPQALHRRIGIVGDVHAEADRLSLVLGFFATRAVELIICVGDIADGIGSVDRCCDLLRLASAVVVSGNHDRWLLSGRMRGLADASSLADVSTASAQYLATRPPTALVETIAGRLLLCHGLGNDDMGRINSTDLESSVLSNASFQEACASDIRFLVCGHTHQPMVRKIGKILVVNPGTLKGPSSAGFAIADFEQKEIELLQLRHQNVHTSLRHRLTIPTENTIELHEN